MVFVLGWNVRLQYAAMWTKDNGVDRTDAWRQGCAGSGSWKTAHTMEPPVMTGKVQVWAFELVVIGLLWFSRPRATTGTRDLTNDFG